MRFVRIASVGLVVATALAGLTACSGTSGSGSTSAAPTTLNVLTTYQKGSPEGNFLADMIQKFQQKTGITVQLSEGGKSTPQVYETSVLGGKEADVVMVNLAETTNDWVKNGIVVPAEKYLDSWGLRSKIDPAALKQWSNAAGQVQGFPYTGFTWPTWYNMDLLKKAGVDAPPTTIDELLADVKALRAAGVPTMAVGGSDWNGQKLFLQIAQSYMSADEATKVFSTGGFCSTPDAMKGIDLFVQLRDAGLFIKDVQGYTVDQMNAAFYGGNAAMMTNGNWAFAKTPPGLNVALAGFPTPSGGAYSKPTAYHGFTSTGFWVSPNGAKKETAVKEFITSFYAPDAVAKFSEQAASPTAAISAGSVAVTNKLLSYSINELPSKVDFAVMPDTTVPGSLAQPQIRQTAVAFAPGTSAQAICSGLDGIYKK